VKATSFFGDQYLEMHLLPVGMKYSKEVLAALAKMCQESLHSYFGEPVAKESEFTVRQIRRKV
jgi:hypothetical protein